MPRGTGLKCYSVDVMQDGRLEPKNIEIVAETTKSALLEAILKCGFNDIIAIEIICDYEQ